MKKQRYPWVFVIIFQGSVKRTGGGGGALVSVLCYLNTQNISQRDQMLATDRKV